MIMSAKTITLYVLIILSAISCRNSQGWDNVKYDTSMKCDSLNSEEIYSSGEHNPIRCKAYFDSDTLVVFLSPPGWRYMTINIHDGKFKAETHGIPFTPEELSFSTITQELQLGKKQYSLNDTICGCFDITFRDIQTGILVYDSVSGDAEMVRDIENPETFDWNFKGTICEIVREKNFDPFDAKNIMTFDAYTAIHEIGEPLQEDTFRISNPEGLSAFRLYALQNTFSMPGNILIKELTWDISPDRDVSDAGKDRLTTWYVEKSNKWMPVRFTRWVEDTRSAEEFYRYPEYKTFNRDLKVFYIKEPAFSKEAEDIEALTLRRDTLKYYSYPDYLKKMYHHNKYLYFDDEGRLRKYWTYNSVSDGSGEFIELRAYYNTKGELIYMDYSDGSNCSVESGYFELRNNRIVAHDNSSECWCCDEDTDSVFTRKLADIGDSLPHKKSSWWDSSCFSDATTLLNVLRIYEYTDGMNEEFLGKENVFAAILDKMEEKEELENETIFFDEKDVGRSRAVVSRDNEKRIRKCYIYDRYLESETFIKLYYDVNGNLFLISYECHNSGYTNRKPEESLLFYVEDGKIVGYGYYNSPALKNKDDDYSSERDRIIHPFIGAELDKTPYMKDDLSRFINTEKLNVYIKKHTSLAK